jgi:hypothetical protein
MEIFVSVKANKPGIVDENPKEIPLTEEQKLQASWLF